MLPELKFKFALPGFGSIELEGKGAGPGNMVSEVSIKFTPSEPCRDKSGVLVRLCRDGNCYVHELKPLPAEEAFEGVGMA